MGWDERDGTVSNRSGWDGIGVRTNVECQAVVAWADIKRELVRLVVEAWGDKCWRV